MEQPGGSGHECRAEAEIAPLAGHVPAGCPRVMLRALVAALRKVVVSDRRTLLAGMNEYRSASVYPGEPGH